MEVFLKGVPATLIEENLRVALAPFLNRLGVADWMVDKLKRRSIAWVTFPNAEEGGAFLEEYGQQRAPPDQAQSAFTKPRVPGADSQHIARLYLLSTPIHVEKSKREVNALAINHLRLERDERQRRPDKGQRVPDISSDITEISCGKLVFGQPNMELKYIQQTHFPSREGYVKFALQSVTVHHDGIARMDMPFHTVQELVFDHKSQGIILILEDPPKFFLQRTNHDGDGDKWERQTSCPLWPDHAQYVAHCLAYQLKLAGDYFSTARAILRQNVLTISHHNVPLTSSPMPTVEDYTTGMKVFDGKMQSFGELRNGVVPFPILFQVQTLVWNNYLHPYSGLCVLEIIENTAGAEAWKNRVPPFTADAMKRVQQKIPYPTPCTEPLEVDPKTFMKNVMSAETDLRRQNSARSGVYGPSLPVHQTWIFKAMVTPTRIFLQGPDAEARNRVLHMFPAHGDHFLRVSFCDEDGQELSFNPKISRDPIFERFREVLLKGIRIAGRHFSFLGFSHSSL